MKKNLKYLTLIGVLASIITVDYGSRIIERKIDEFYFKVGNSIGYVIKKVLDGSFDHLIIERQKYKEKKEFLDRYEEERSREKYRDVG